MVATLFLTENSKHYHIHLNPLTAEDLNACQSFPTEQISGCLLHKHTIWHEQQ